MSSTFGRSYFCLAWRDIRRKTKQAKHRQEDKKIMTENIVTQTWVYRGIGLDSSLPLSAECYHHHNHHILFQLCTYVFLVSLSFLFVWADLCRWTRQSGGCEVKTDSTAYTVHPGLTECLNNQDSVWSGISFSHLCTQSCNTHVCICRHSLHLCKNCMNMKNKSCMVMNSITIIMKTGADSQKRVCVCVHACTSPFVQGH